MSDREFSIHDLRKKKGIYLNCPKQKDQNQFLEKDFQTNFDIGSLKIHVQCFLLSSNWQVLFHIINITMSPIGSRC